MSRSTNAALKTGLLATTTATGDAMSKAASLKLCADTLAKAITGLKSAFQGLSRLEPVLNSACIAALNHANAYRDARPAHAIIKNVMEIGKTTDHVNTARQYRAEIVAWFRANSPIYWDKDGNVHVHKDGETGFKPFTPEAAAKEAFYDRPAAKEARTAAAKASERTLNPVDAGMLRARIYGLKTFIESAEKPNADGKVRGVINKARLLKVVNAVIAVADEELPETTNEAQVSRNVKAMSSTLIKKGSKRHKKATARTARASNGATQAAANG